MKKFISILCLFAFFGCGQTHHKKHVKSQQVHCYKQHVTHADGSSDWIFWYMIWTMNNQSCYYYSSPTAITNYSTVNWQESKESPIANMDEKDIQQMPEQEVAEQNLSTEMQTEMNENAENFGGMTEDEMGDYEGGETNNDAGDNTSTDNSEGGSEGGSSDGGSSDGGGGGDGGGDGGGGGE